MFYELSKYMLYENNMQPKMQHNNVKTETVMSANPQHNAANLENILSTIPQHNAANLENILSTIPQHNAANLENILSPIPQHNAANLENILSQIPQHNAANLENILSQIPQHNAPKWKQYATKSAEYPPFEDSLFWCFFILSKGDFHYETMKKSDLISKQLKIEYIQKIRENKKIIKLYKFDTLSNIENNLVNDKKINVKTFLSLCLIENINVFFVSKKTYIENFMNDTNIIYVIYETPENKYNNKYGYEIASDNIINNIRSTLYKIELDAVNKPIKSISSYKLSDLYSICNKLAINTININGKKLTKNDLYQLIVEYFK